MEQITIPFKFDTPYLSAYFERAAGKPVSLTLTDNSTRMLSVKVSGGRVVLRLHRIFLDAGPAVIGEIADFIKAGRRKKTPLISGFLRDRSVGIVRKAPRNLNPAGKFYDLKGIFDGLNREYFGCALNSSITWGRKAAQGRVRKRTLGSYSFQAETIRINPILDSAKVPLRFVEFIVYHEMLHSFIGVGTKGGRRAVHTKEFREKERLFRDYSTALKWEAENLKVLA